MIEATIDERIHALWDELTEFDAASHDTAFHHFLKTLCRLVGAQNANWTVAVRLSDMIPGDPVFGWRPRITRFLRASSEMEAMAREQVRLVELGQVDATTMANVALFGRMRVNRLCDLVPPAWFESDYYQICYCQVGFSDAIWAGCPVNDDAEVYLGLYRAIGQPRFQPEERDTVHAALRGLKWFLRQQLLGYGLLVANAPLTPGERQVLQGLLRGQLEKQIADTLGLSCHTTHEYVKRIFRKFNVNNRASLMALWLGQPAPILPCSLSGF